MVDLCDIVIEVVSVFCKLLRPLTKAKPQSWMLQKLENSFGQGLSCGFRQQSDLVIQDASVNSESGGHDRLSRVKVAVYLEGDGGSIGAWGYQNLRNS
jgi:hypothetical protein